MREAYSLTVADVGRYQTYSKRECRVEIADE
jgi:hypothetical protein